MAKHLAVTLLMIIALVLCSSISSTHGARVDATFTSLKPIHHSGNDKGDSKKEVKAIDEELENCDGKSNEEECLMRRTMIAHVDYIYTQNNHH